MKTKKHSIVLSSILSEFILQRRNSNYQETSKKLSSVHERVNQMHRNHQYSKQVYLDLIEKAQYNIEQKLSSKQNRILKTNTVLIHFKLTQKLHSSMTYIESWLVSIERNDLPLKHTKINFHQELVYLLQQVLRALKCQFLNDFATMSQQLRSRYILDYEVQVNPNKKSLKKLYPLHYEKMWKKEAFLDEQNKLTVTCYHNTHKKLQQMITKERQWSRGNIIKTNLKHGSEQTKPSNSGEYELSTSTEEKGQKRQSDRKTSLIEFYDEDLNITVLSNDSETFKKSTGRIEGVYTGEDFEIDNEQNKYDSDDEFQLLIEEGNAEESVKDNRNKVEHTMIKSIQKDLSGLLLSLDQAIEGYFYDL